MTSASTRRSILAVAATLSLTVGVIGGFPAGPAFAEPGPGSASEVFTTTRVSASTDGEPGNDRSDTPAISGDGTVVAFASIASNLVPGDNNRGVGGQFSSPDRGKDIFVRDLATGAIERVSVHSDGSESGLESVSDAPALTTDGRFVAFHSTAGLVPSEFNGRRDIYLHDRSTGITELASPALDGNFGNDDSSYPAISADGRYVTFHSFASNLVEGDTNGTLDIFVRDRVAGTTERVSVASDGTEGDGFSLFPSLSADGRFVSFVSQAGNLVVPESLGLFDVFIHDRQTRTTEQVSLTSNGTIGNEISYFSSLSGDGRLVAFDSTANNLVPGDANDVSDVFIRDRETQLTHRVSVTSSGEELDGHSIHPSISADGRFVSFTSEASDVVDGASSGVRKVYVHDRMTGMTSLVSRAVDGIEPNGPTETDSALHAMSDDGRRFAVSSAASNIVPNDTNDARDVFSFERPIHLGVDQLAADPVGGQLSVSGTARAAGTVLTDISDAADAGPSAAPIGGDLTRVRVAYRTELEDILATIEFAPPPKPPTSVRMFPGTQNIRPPLPGGSLGVVHGLSVTIAGQRYEIRGLAATATSGDPTSMPFFGLYRCDVVCLEIARLQGGHTTTGTTVVVSLPLSAVDAQEGAALTGIRAFAALGEGAPGSAVTLDQVDLPDVTIPARRVSLGIAPVGTAEADVAFDTSAELEGEGFSGFLDISSLHDGGYEVWARTCLGDDCRAASLPVILGDGSNQTETVFSERSATTGQFSDEMLLEASLVKLGGEPIADAEMVFELTGANTVRSFSVTTDEQGRAAITPTLTETPGPYQLTVRYPGDVANEGSADTTGFLVEKEDSDSELTVEGKGGKRTVEARLSDRDSASTGIAGRTIDFYADSELIGSAITDATGVATLQAPPRFRAGKHDFEAHFDGDDYYLSSSDGRQT